MTTPAFRRITPRLPVEDLEASLAFYRDSLGCRVLVLWPDTEPTFALVERDGVEVGLVSREARELTIGYAELYVEVTDAAALHRDLLGRVPIAWGPEVYAYGRREFAVYDPDGYMVIFTEPTDDPPSTPEPG